MYYFHKNNEFDYLSVLFKNLYYLLVILLFFMEHNFFLRGSQFIFVEGETLEAFNFFFFNSYNLLKIIEARPPLGHYI